VKVMLLVTGEAWKNSVDVQDWIESES
jgi:hypothetical protein